MPTDPPTPAPPASPPPLAFRSRECAAALGISEGKLAELTADPASGIPHCRWGRVLVYPVRELMDWLAAQAAKEGPNARP